MTAWEIRFLLAFAAGLGCGLLLALIFYSWHQRKMTAAVNRLLDEAEERGRREAENLYIRLKDSLGALSLEALSRNTAEFLKLSREVLDRKLDAGSQELQHKKEMIDETLQGMKQELQQVQELVSRLEKDREQKFGDLSRQLRQAGEQTLQLQATTNRLQSALASTSSRGQWGERMAEDVLRLAGFVEGINYLKQHTLTAATRPDYTFLLPRGLRLNMDVKFPLNNYLKLHESREESARKNFQVQFLRDVRQRLKEVTSRDYINPEDNTVDCVLVFIPNEQVYSFIHQHDRQLLDEALRQKVILCSPTTLYAVLAVIRQAVDNFNLERTAAQVLSLLGTFDRQWQLFMTSFDKLGRKIDETRDEYQKLTTTRKNQLERQLAKIDDLRRRENLPDPGSQKE